MKTHIDTRIKEMRQKQLIWAEKGENEVWTTLDLAEGKVAIEYNGDLKRLNKVLMEAFPKDKSPCFGNGIFYHRYIGHRWISRKFRPNLPTVSETEIKLKSEIEDIEWQKNVLKIYKLSDEICFTGQSNSIGFKKS